VSGNAYALAAREQKASKIAVVLWLADRTVAQAAALGEHGRRVVEQAARVKPSSDETWALVLDKLTEMHVIGADRRAAALALPADLLAGVPKGPRP